MIGVAWGNMYFYLADGMAKPRRHKRTVVDI